MRLYKFTTKIWLMILISFSVGMFLFIDNANASTTTRSYGSGLQCDQKGKSGKCLYAVQPYNNYQYYVGRISATLEGHGAFGPAGGRGSVAGCLTGSTGTMWTGSCWVYVPDHLAGGDGEGTDVYGNITRGIGNDVNAAYGKFLVEMYGNDATWHSFTFWADGRKVDNVTVTIPNSDQVGGSSFPTALDSDEGHHISDNTINWAPAGRINCNIWFNGQDNLPGSVGNTCNCVNAGNATINFNAKGPSAGGYTSVTGSDTINCFSPAPICSPGSQTIISNGAASFTATSGDGNYSWSAPGGVPNNGSGSSFSTTYATGGAKTVTVTSGGLTDTCSVTVRHRLNVSKISGGSVTSAPAGINCGSDCTEDYSSGTGVTLTATPNSGYFFKRWDFGNTCTGSPANVCATTMNQNRNLTAIFDSNPAPEADVRCNGLGGSCNVAYNAMPIIEWCGTGAGRHNCTDATSCTATGTAGAGNPPDTLSGNWTTPNLSSDATYTLTCTGPGGSTVDFVDVNVAAPPPETVDLRCDGSGGSCTINYNDTSDITWTSTNVAGCVFTAGLGSGGWSGTTGLAGAHITPALLANQTYTINCDAGAATDSVTVIVTQPSVDLKCNGGNACNIPFDSTADMTWTSSSAVTDCSFSVGSGSGGWSGTTGLTGTHITPKLTSDETYTINCNPGPVSDSITITVDPPPPPDFNVNFGLTAIVTNPSVSNVTVTEPNYCIFGPLVTVTWDFTDPAGDPFPSGSQIQVATDAGFTNIVHDSCPAGPPLGTCDPTNNVTTYVTPSFLYNQTYYTRVRSWNSVSDVSNYTNMSICNGPGCIGGTSWKTPVHAYPQTDFTAIPGNPSAGGTSQFTDTTVFGVGSIDKSWSWSFVGGAPNIAVGAGPHVVTYGVAGTYPATLTASDDVGACSISGSIYVQGKLPKWREVAPR